MTEPTSSLRVNAINAMTDYLHSCGWKQSSFEPSTFGYFTDPLTDMVHRVDFAWFIQTEREVIRAIENRVD